jgi:hypothetical protein
LADFVAEVAEEIGVSRGDDWPNVRGGPSLPALVRTVLAAA